jgi:hypothetical protein
MKPLLLIATLLLTLTLHSSASAVKQALSRTDLERLAGQLTDEELWEDDTVLVKINNLLDDTSRRLKATTTASTLSVLAPTTAMTEITLTTQQTTIIDIGYKVLSGLMADSYFPNASNCFARATNFSFLEIPTYQYNFTQMTALSQDVSSNSTTVWSAYYSASVYSTRLVQNATNHLWVCNSMAKNVYTWGYKKASLFTDFTTMATAFFQNLLSKVISINNIYNSIQSKQQSGDTTGVYYDLARLVRILMDFYPVEDSALITTTSSDAGLNDQSLQ